MNPFLESGIVAAVTCLASLLVTFIFNKVAGIPKEWNKSLYNKIISIINKNITLKHRKHK